MLGIIGKKVGMTSIYTEAGKNIACTVVECGPCVVTQVKTEEDLASASGAGSEVNYNLGIIAVKKADYEGAARYFGSDCSFNAALATLLGGDAEGASKKVDCIKDKEDAMNYYLKAITGARTGNSEIVLNNLRAAVGKDAALGTKAKTDMEFRKFFEDETFKSIAR